MYNKSRIATLLILISITAPSYAVDFLYRISSNDPGVATYSLDVGDLGTGLQQGVLLPKDNVSGQYWHLVPAPLGNYKLTNTFQGSGMCLDVAHDGGTYMDTCGQQLGQMWMLEEVTGQGVRLLNSFKPGQCLDYMAQYVPALNIQVGVTLLSPCNGSDSQTWTISNTGKL